MNYYFYFTSLLLYFGEQIDQPIIIGSPSQEVLFWQGKKELKDIQS